MEDLSSYFHISSTPEKASAITLSAETAKEARNENKTQREDGAFVDGGGFPSSSGGRSTGIGQTAF
jgi:hypothetical protein